MSTPTAYRDSAAHSNTANAATCTIALPSTLVAGDTLIVHATAPNSSVQTWSAVCGSGGSHSLGSPVAQATRTPGLDSVVFVYVVQSGDASSNLVITNGAAGHLIGATATAFSQMGVLDVSQIAVSTSSSVTVPAPAVTPTQVDDTIVILVAENDATGRTWGATAGGGAYTKSIETNGGAVASSITAAAYYDLDYASTSSTGVINATVGTPSNGWTAITLAFKKPAGNVSPTANAGVDQTVDPGLTITLDGSGSFDPDGTIASYAWTQLSGTTVTLSSSSVQKPTFTSPSLSLGDTLVFGLVVTDNAAASSTQDTVSIVVNGTSSAALGFRASDIFNGGAAALATGVIPAATQSGDLILMFLDVHVPRATSPAIDPGGWTRIFECDLGAAANSQTVGWKRSATGTDAASAITVAWGDGTVNGKWLLTFQVAKHASSTLKDVQVFSETTSRQAHPVPSVTAGATAGCWLVEHVTDTGSPCSTAFTKPAALTLRSEFYETGGGSMAASTAGSNGPVATGVHSGDVYTGTLTTNNAATVAILLQPGSANLPPVANAGPDQSGIEPWTTVTLDGSGSSDPDGSIATYGWTQTGGPSVTLTNAASAVATFTAPGVLGGTQLVFSLVVMDNSGASSPIDSVVINVLTATEFIPHAGAWKGKITKFAHGGAWV